MSRAEHLVTAGTLATELASPRPPVVLDVRWRLGDEPGAGRAAYLADHLAGAQFLDMEEVLTGHTGDPRDGRHPLPAVEGLTSGLRALGVGAGADVVVYDDPGSFAADRAWWVLRWAGIRTRVLDGGLAAWIAASGATESGATAARPTAQSDRVETLPSGLLPSLTVDEAAQFPTQGTLVDCRAPERFSGAFEPFDPRAGHIPGAVNVSAATLFTPDGRLPSDDELRARLRELTAGGPVAAYCGSGVSAAHDVLALAVIGHEAALFPGSWSAWSNDPSRPVATGGG